MPTSGSVFRHLTGYLQCFFVRFTGNSDYELKVLRALSTMQKSMKEVVTVQRKRRVPMALTITNPCHTPTRLEFLSTSAETS